MKKAFLLLALLFGVSLARAAPADRFSMTHSTFIAPTSTWSNVALTSNTVRQGDMLAYITISSAAASTSGSVVTVYDGLDSGGTKIAEVDATALGVYPFEVYLTSSSKQVTINKTGTAAVGITFYITHPVY